MTRQIQSALAWIGVDWDEGPFLQSERLARHRERGRGAARRRQGLPLLLHPRGARGPARRGAEAGRRLPLPAHLPATVPRTRCGAPGRAASPSPSASACRTSHIRFHDLVRGDMDFPPDALDDFILLRSDGSPTYHMSVVVDDIDMADHPRHPRRGPPVEHAQAHPALPGAWAARCRPSATCR